MASLASVAMGEYVFVCETCRSAVLNIELSVVNQVLERRLRRLVGVEVEGVQRSKSKMSVLGLSRFAVA